MTSKYIYQAKGETPLKFYKIIKKMPLLSESCVFLNLLVYKRLTSSNDEYKD